MPRGDGTGPMGYGPMTGRGMGYCVAVPGYLNPGYGPGRGLGRGFGRGLGRGFGRGMGWRWWNQPAGGWAYPPAAPYAPANPGAEADFLRNQARLLEEELGSIRGRLEELEKDQEKE